MADIFKVSNPSKKYVQMMKIRIALPQIIKIGPNVLLRLDGISIILIITIVIVGPKEIPTVIRAIKNVLLV